MAMTPEALSALVEFREKVSRPGTFKTCEPGNSCFECLAARLADEVERLQADLHRAEIDMLGYDLLRAEIQKSLEREKVLREVLESLFGLGRKDTSNTKYDGYYMAVKRALAR